MAKQVFYDNQDGLRQRFGVRPTENNIAAVNPSANGEKVVEVYVRGEDVPDVAVAPDTRAAYIPGGAYIVSATLLVQELFVGATATLDIGTFTVAGVLVADDNIDSGITVATLTAGADIACDGTLVGTHVAAGGARVAFSYDTAAFTAGSAKLVIKYIEPPVQTA